ncbi:hypothetical protein AAMO2058_000684800 [Amorphochlora amoebiformis]
MCDGADSDSVVGVGWSSQSELFTVADDKTLMQWTVNAECKGKICPLDHYPTAFTCAPSASSMVQNFVVGFSNGMFQIISKSGRVERKVQGAHKGAILTCKFSHDGTALMTGGEDGYVKKWSKTGNLQSKLCNSGRAVYSLTWCSDNQSVLYCSEKFLTIKPLSPSMKEIKWKAHDAIVLAVDWNPINNLIISGGEDCKYKIWDSFGRQIFASNPLSMTVTSVSWAPKGDVFAIGSFCRILLCDRHGWAQSSQTCKDSGSFYQLAWTHDGTQVAGAGASGMVWFGQKIGELRQWGHIQAKVKDLCQIHVTDLSIHSGLSEDSKQLDTDESSDQGTSGTYGEELEFSDRIVEVSIWDGQLIVVTQRACYIYKCIGGTFTLHYKFELGGTGAASLVVQSKGVFLIATHRKGIQLFSPDGRLRCAPKAPGLGRPRFLRRGNIALASDVLAAISRANPREVLLLDTETGRPFAEPYQHPIAIEHIALSQGPGTSRKLLIIDTNRDLYITRLHQRKLVKLATMVDSARWHDGGSKAEAKSSDSGSIDALACVSHGQLVVWYYPHAAYVDPDLLPKTKSIVANASVAFGKQCDLVSFYGSTITARRADGAYMSQLVSPFPLSLLRFAAAGKWAQCARLCRFAQRPILWACLAAVALERMQLEVAAVSFAALDEVEKLQAIQRVISIPSREGQHAELLIYQRRPDAGEQILLNAGLIYRAIKLNMRLFRWKRALEIARKYQQRGISHVDTVLGYRERYLMSFHKEEEDKEFVELRGKIRVNWSTIESKEHQEYLKEAKKSVHPAKKSVILNVVLDTQAKHKEARKKNQGAPQVDNHSGEGEAKSKIDDDIGTGFDQDDELQM